MSITGVLNTVSPSTVQGPTKEQFDLQVKLLDKAQELAREQASVLINSLDTLSPSSGKQSLDVHA